MSGGFFRGTSADQDTRFSNKQAKLLKTQKFAPELDHLVDMSKVKMDVMKPWIAKRVTELLGFEDEVLINFIYGLLEEKEADGKKIQIQLTGFMEKNTVKFMKELWTLLLSAQQNASGVPQQFLDAKEAEIQQRKAEDDRIAQEIQKKREKEGRDLELEKQKRMDGNAGNSRSSGDPTGSAINNTTVNAEEEMDLDFKRSSRTKNRGSRRSRSISLSPRGRRRSISPRKRPRSPSRRSRSIDRQRGSSRRSTSPRRSASPRRHSPRRRSPYSRRGSPSLPRFSSGRHRSPSPARRRPRSPSPGRRRPRSPSPGRRRPRSPSPGRRRPRSPSPGRRRPRSPSPGSHRPHSPSPGRHRPWSRSPVKRRSPSPKRRRRSPSPRTRYANRRPSPQRRRGISPYSSKSPNRSRRSLSIEADKRTDGTPSIKDRVVPERDQERRSDGDNDRDGARIGDGRSTDSEHRLLKSLRSPNNEERNSTCDRSSGKQLPSQDSTDASGDEEEGSRARENARKANSARRKTKDSADRRLNKIGAGASSPGEKSPFMIQSGKGVLKKHPDQLSESSEDDLVGRSHRTDSPDERSPPRIEKDDLHPKDGRESEHAMMDSRDESDDAIKAKKFISEVNGDSQSEDGSPVKKPKKRTDTKSHIDSRSSGSEEPDKHRSHSEKRRHKKAHRHKRKHDDSSESDTESDGKEAKRRRKEEKRLRKEERRRRREERHRRRAERHASKQKMKQTHADALPSDSEKDRDSNSDVDVRKRGSPAGREESDQKKLEIELREKALESLRAKKAINN
ncbi:serine/arginine repetitive matrix protein 1-like isoform X3 [Panicum virgatum]|uniref:serine/arginine repetitive matrix protein 1-like isoform X3 n=1 Tax=Panicum virgatum TaxID=38727 RepID=UPI0019D4EF2B|nr:serine/arginine repetitive matrix protein 1-like isoform X3 [Panicum virgatum]